MNIQKLYATNKALVWAVGVVIVLGAVWYLSAGTSGWSDQGTYTAPTSSTGTTTKPPASGTTKPTAPKPTPTTAKMVGVNTLAYLFNLKQPLVCAIKPSALVKRTGTMYIANGQMRANFTTTSMIDDGAFLYAWTNGATTGLKLTAGSSVSGSAIASKGGFDLVNDISYACNPWTVDASVFTPPSSISFSDSY